MKPADFPIETSAMDESVVNKTGYTPAKRVAELNFHKIRSYVEILCNSHICCGLDPFELDEIRRSNHNTIAAAFNIPRKLVSMAGEDTYSIYMKTRRALNGLDGEETATLTTVQKFIERLVELRYEFYMEGKWQEFVEKVANTWVDKDFEDLDGIPDLSN